MRVKKENKKVMLIYPPGKLYQRGEDRCQGNVEDSAATNIHACNDLGYVAAGIKNLSFDIFLKDYQAENLSAYDLINEFTSYKPDLLFVSITNATIFSDIEIVNRLKEISPDLIVILKGAMFFNADDALLESLDLSRTDYLVGGESDFVTAKLIKCHFEGGEPDKIPGVIFRKNGEWTKTDFSSWDDEPDKLPFPAREFMNNSLYVRPDTGELQATIAVARGCSSSCVYCLTPVISGKKVRSRSPENVLAELQECYTKYGISNFFLKSDTFTIDKKWVVSFCELIINSNLSGKIQWVANSKTKPVDTETLKIMKKAGCWLIAFGFETGSTKTMKMLNKGTTVDDSYKATECAREAGLKIFGFYMAGFLWETEKDLRDTQKLIFDLDTDFIEIHIPVPYPGTMLYKMAVEKGFSNENVAGKDYYRSPFSGMEHLDSETVLKFRKKVLFKYYFRFSYIFARFCEAIRRPVVLKNYAAYAVKLFYKTVTSV